MMAAADKYFGETLGIGDPSDEPVLVVPHDENPLEHGKPNYLYVGVAGSVSMFFGKTEETISVTLGQGYHLFRPTRINAAGTTASEIIAFYDGVFG